MEFMTRGITTKATVCARNIITGDGTMSHLLLERGGRCDETRKSLFQHQLEKRICLLEMEKMAVATVARMLYKALGLQKKACDYDGCHCQPSICAL